jgi:SPP1 family predicted phage head-tail adaptor
MRSGELKHKVSIERNAERRGDNGEIIRAWTTLALRWSSIEPLAGRELEYAHQMHADANIKFRMRFLDGMTPSDRIVMGTRVFNVLSVRNMDEAGVETEALCKEVT